jgi:hypothetical protein
MRVKTDHDEHIKRGPLAWSADPRIHRAYEWAAFWIEESPIQRIHREQGEPALSEADLRDRSWVPSENQLKALDEILSLLDQGVAPPDGREEGHKSDGESRAGKNRKVREHLIAHPEDTSAQVAKALGYPTKTVRGLEAWKARESKTRPKSKQTVKERPLTGDMLKAITGPDARPEDIAEAREKLDVIKAQYIDSLTSSERAKFHALKPEDQLALLAEHMTGIPD